MFHDISDDNLSTDPVLILMLNNITKILSYGFENFTCFTGILLLSITGTDILGLLYAIVCL